MSWSEQETNILKKLWADGLSAAQISIRIPGKTRNACIGRAHRLNLQSRAKSRKSSSKSNVKFGNSTEVSQKKLSRKARFKSILLDKNFEPENPKKTEELDDTTCRWPNHHPDEKDFYFCGRNPLKGFSYCKLHVLYAFQPRNAKEDDQITPEDMPQHTDKKIRSA